MEVNIKIKQEHLEVSECEAWLRSSEDGGVVLFVGNIRQFNRGQQVDFLEFEAYEEMVHHQLHLHARVLQEKFAIHKVLLHHRVGTLYPGETAVIAGIAAPHRKEAFEACMQLMTTLKEDIPIWKKEVYEDGHHWISSTP